MLRQNTMTTVRRSVPYPGVGSRFYLPLLIWNNTIEALHYYRQYRSEALVYWGGAIGGAGETLVTSLIKLNHIPQGGCVRPKPDEMRALLRTLRARDEKLVAQIHSHPGEAFHSWGDSQHATSFHLGFISIVLPDFGDGVTTLSDCAVYEFRGEFVALSPSEIADRFLVHDLVVELAPCVVKTEADMRMSRWSGLSRKLRSIGFKKQ